MVTGRSVFGRSVRHGMPSTVVSSWMPPQSVTTSAAPRTSDRNSRYRAAPRPGVGRRPRSPPPPAWPAARMQRQDDRERAASRRSAPRARRPRPACPRSRADGASRRHSARACPGAPATGAGSNRSRCAQQGVDHRIADEVRPVARSTPSRARLSRPSGLVTNSRSDEHVRDPPVDLLRHRRVEAAEAGLDVRERDEQLRAHERRGERGVHVAVDDHQRRSVGDERVLERRPAAPPSGRPGSRADAEAHVRCGQLEVAEEHVGQARVVVLAGVDDALRDARARPAPR